MCIHCTKQTKNGSICLLIVKVQINGNVKLGKLLGKIVVPDKNEMGFLTDFLSVSSWTVLFLF